MSIANNKPAILYVHYGQDWIRGSEIVLLDVLREAKQNGYNVYLWCNSSLLATSAREYIDDVCCEPLVCLGYWTKPRWNVSAWANQLANTKRLIRRWNIDVVHCNSGAPCQWLTPACKWLKVPLLLHLHAQYQQFDRLALLFSGADKVVGVSQSVLDCFKGKELAQDKGIVIYNGVKSERAISNEPVNVRAMIDAADSDIVLLFVGSLIKRKSLETLLMAMAKVSNSHRYKLAIIGGGERETALRNLSKALGLSHQVFFLGERDNVNQFYSSNADAFVSVPEAEVFGLTLAEASLARLPIITTDVPGVNEIYQDGENARLIEAGNSEALAEVLADLAKEPAEFLLRSIKAQQHILENFSTERQFSQLADCYQNLMLNKPEQGIFSYFFTSLCEFSRAFMMKLKRKFFAQNVGG